ncbi:MAG: DNA polymerase III subunit alpha [bacterium]
MKFVHLHVHSHYSLLDGLGKINDIVRFAKEDGAGAIAITDHGVMHGVIEFYQKCKKAGIKPIIGMEMYTTPGSRFDRSLEKGQKQANHLILLAKNNIGYKNLLKITSIGHLEGYYYKPRVDWEILQKYHEGLIACSACLGGEIPQLIIAGKDDEARKRILDYAKLFGPDNYYLEIQDHPDLEYQEIVNKKLIAFSKELGIPLIATNDPHYVRADDNEAQDILLCLQNKAKKTDTQRMCMLDGNYSLRPTTEMVKLFEHIPEAITNTEKIAEMCNVEIELGNVQLPHFEVPAGYDDFSYLEKISRDGLFNRYGKTYEEIDHIYKERLDYELSVIKKMGWPSYFLIVSDFVNWARKNDIVVGPGRGSAAGSLVSYAIGITNLCPIKYELLFERFLNPDRISMPDIDLDFADTRRSEVIDYVQEKYGEDHVAQIITFGTMAARAAVRDVGRVLDYPYDYCDKIAKAIPMFMKISQALDTVPDFQEIYQEADAKIIIDYAIKLEGVARHASVHACGVLITKEPLTETVPVQHASSSDKAIVSQYSLHPVEDLGLLKMDFLGLRNLSVIEAAINIIKNTEGAEINIDDIPLDDSKTFALFQKAETTGVFQLESSGMKRYLRELQATEFEDIIAMVALYRPGPMEWIPDYIAGKHGKKEIVYLHPKLEPILEKTYGVAIYQEQVMRMARDIAGFTMAEADVLRKAVGKKIAKLLEQQRDKFISGCLNNGLSKALGEKLFSFIEPFAGYGFNRSHAACYAMIGYQTAYLKANYPTQFMAALLTADQGETDRVAIEIEECHNMGINVRQPDINQSYESFTVVTSGTEKGTKAKEGEKINTIRFGLNAIKNMGAHIAEAIIKERKKNGPYKDMSDFLERVEDKDLNKKSLESLIKTGAFDKFGERGALLHNLENMLSFHRQITQEKNNNQSSLFSDGQNQDLMRKLNLEPAEPASNIEKLTWEKELLGLYISDHPFNDYKKQLSNIIIPLANLKESGNNNSATIAGVITNIKKILTRKNDNMLFVKIEDGIDNVEILVFPKLLQTTQDIWNDGQVVICQGTVSDKDGETKLLANKCSKLALDNLSEDIKNFNQVEAFGNNGNNNYSNNYNNHNHNYNYKHHQNTGYQAPPIASPLKLIIQYDQMNDELLNQLKNILSKSKGQSHVYLKIVKGQTEKVVESSLRVNNNYNLIKEIKKKFKGVVKIA